MTFIISALYFEAKEIISQFELKKVKDIKKYQIFGNENIYLILSGVGVWNSIFATTFLLSKYSIGKNDRVYNIGSCGKIDKEIEYKKPLFPNKIIFKDRCYYPDILEKHPFKEVILNTLDANSSDFNLEAQIVDNEASGVFFSAEKFLYLNNIFFIKIPTDSFFDSKKEKEKIFYRYNCGIKDVIKYLNSIFFIGKKYPISKTDNLQIMKNNLKLSTTMYEKLKKLLKYSEITGKNLDKYLNIKAKDKNEGKKILKEIENKLTK